MSKIVLSVAECYLTRFSYWKSFLWLALFVRLQGNRRLVVKDLGKPKKSQYETENKQICRKFASSQKKALCKFCHSSKGQMPALQWCPYQIKNVGNDLVILSCSVWQSDSKTAGRKLCFRREVNRCSVVAKNL